MDYLKHNEKRKGSDASGTYPVVEIDDTGTRITRTEDETGEHLTLETVAAGSADLMDFETRRAVALRDRRERFEQSSIDDFLPSGGCCFSCGCDLVAELGIRAVASGKHITGCPVCHRSFL